MGQAVGVPDDVFAVPRLAAVYDLLDSDRRDLDAYAARVEEFAARSVIDLGCGTGTLACLLARRGVEVTGVDLAEASFRFSQARSRGGPLGLRRRCLPAGREGGSGDDDRECRPGGPR